jgi:RNase P/RNase MRP subunit p29
MPIAGISLNPKSVLPEHLDLKPGDLSGSLVRGGIIQDFASRGITDLSTKQQMTIEDGLVTVKNTLRVKDLEIDKIVINDHPVIEFERGVVKINGQLKADVQQTELKVTDKVLRAAIETHDTSYLDGAGISFGAGAQLSMTYDHASQSFGLTTNFNLALGKSYKIDSDTVLSKDRLGNSVLYSKLRTVGLLKDLEVEGDLIVNDDFFFSGDTGKMALGHLEPLYKLHILDGDQYFMIGEHRTGFSAGTLNGVSWNLISGGRLTATLSEGSFWVNPDNQMINDAVLRVSDRGQLNQNYTLAIDSVAGRSAIIVKNSETTELRLHEGELTVSRSISIGERSQSYATGMPRTGTHARGSIVWNSEPVQGSYAGWICTATGEPGEWRPFGKID